MKESERASKDSGEGEFIRLFLKHEPVLRAYARTILPTILPDWNSVEDALQEASVTMWEKIAQLDDADGFLPWAKVILKYKCLQAITRLRRERPVLSDAVLHLLSEEADSLVENKYSQMRLALNTCMAQIPPIRFTSCWDGFERSLQFASNKDSRRKMNDQHETKYLDTAIPT